MVHFSGFLIVVAVFLEKSVANERSSGTSRDECKKDLLFILDASLSVRDYFDNTIKRYLVKIIEDMNVQPLGTQVAMITFSSQEKTKLMLGFAPREEQTVINYINNGLDFYEIFGVGTYTGKAMKIAEEQVFPNQSPDNHRGNIEDVAIIITDGDPNPVGQIKIATSHAQKLRIRGVRVIGVAVGRTKTTPSIRETLVDIVGDPSWLFESEFEYLDDIAYELIGASCIENCECPTDTNIIYVKSDTQTCSANWSEPKPTCKNGEQVAKTTLTQDISGSQLPIGKHSLKYSYKLSNSDIDLKCNVDYDVKVLPCNAEDYDPKKKKCCSGILHELNNGYECCGSQYYDTSTMQCCFKEYGIAKQKDEACPTVHC